MKLYIVNEKTCSIDTEEVISVGRKYVYRVFGEDGWNRKKNEFTCIIKACKYLIKICDEKIKCNNDIRLTLKNNNIVIAENKEKARRYIDWIKKQKVKK